MASSWLEREVEQVIQTYLLRSSKLSRAKLCPAVLFYLKKKLAVYHSHYKISFLGYNIFEL